MMKKLCLAALVLAGVSAAPAFAGSTFPYTCSNVNFSYVNNQAAIQGTCLRANGTPNNTTLVLNGISNQNGRLVQGSGASTFQQSCGSIKVLINGPEVLLSAQCRTESGSSNATSLSLNNIGNNNGNLAY